MLFKKTEEEWKQLKNDRSIQELWDKSCLHRQWAIGSDMSLITLWSPSTIEEWDKLYLDSGEARDYLVFNHREHTVLNDFMMVYNKPNELLKLPANQKDINFNYGRSKSSIYYIGSLFQQFLKNHSVDRDIEFCSETVYLHAVIETWDGKKREVGVINSLKTKFPSYIYKFTDNFTDSYYSIDFEVYSLDNKLICGIQIKPPSYFSKANTEGLIKARKDNFIKHRLYEKDSGAAAFFIVANKDGTIHTNKFKQEEYVDQNTGCVIKQLDFNDK